MSTEQIQGPRAMVVDIAERLARRSDQTVGTIREPAPVESREPAWLRAGRATARAPRLAVLGVASTTRHAWNYQQAGTVTTRIRNAQVRRAAAVDPEEQDRIDEEIQALQEERRQLRQARHRQPAAIAGAVGVPVVVSAVAIAAVLVGLVVPAAVAGIGAGGALWAGRREEKRRGEIAAAVQRAQLEAAGGEPEPEGPRPEFGEGGVYTPEDLGAGRPFPIARATTEAEAAECILRALGKEGIPVGDVSEVQRTAWGWQAVVRVTEGTPAAIIAKASDLETLFDTAQGSVRPQPSIERRARALLRIVESDPFASAPPPEYRAPKSMSISDRARIGSSIDGDPLLVTLAGVMAAIVAASGGGKTGILQALGEVTTACRDAITIDLDPHGDGLEDLGPAARMQGRTHEQIEHVLLFLLMLCKARARLRKTLGMGRKWVTTPEHPAIVVLFDEFPKASTLAKKLAFELLLVGRKEGVWMVLASQGGTKTYLGESIAQMLAMQIMGPCKVGDTRAVMGEGSVAEGWLPHRLSPATDTDPRDAGHIYAKGVPGTQDEPVEHKIHEHPRGQLAKLAEERRDAGLLDPDAESLAAMATVDLPDYVEPEYDNDGNVKKEAPVDLLTWEQLLRLCEADPPAEGVTPESIERQAVRHALEAMDAAGADRMRVETMATLIQQRHPDLHPVLTPSDLGARLRDAGCGGTVSIGAVDGRENARGYRREALEAAL